MILTIANLKGGSGKTTTAVYLAAGLAATARTLLVDADPLASALTWADLADGALPCPVVGLAVPRLDRRLPAVGEGYRHVVIDCPPDVAEITAGAVRAADVVVVPLAPTILDVARLAPTADLIVEASAGRDRPPAVLAVLTRARPRVRSRAAVRAQLEADGWAVAPDDVPEWEAIAQAAGTTPRDLTPYASVLAAVRALASGRRAAA